MKSARGSLFFIFGNMAITDEIILSEAIRLVESGVSVTFPVNGKSMLPFIIGGRESLILVKPQVIKKGDIVLAFVDGNRYVIHRVINIHDENVTLMGDGNLAQCEYCKMSDIKALATHAINKSNARRYLYARHRCIAAKLWLFLLPLRKWLLRFYRLTHN